MIRPSFRTVTVLLIGVGATAVIATAVSLGIGGNEYSLAIRDVGQTCTVLASAMVTLAIARSFERGEPLRITWSLIGYGSLAFALGDGAWSIIELTSNGPVPVPGLPDLFYLAEYVLVAAALLRVGVAYNRLMDTRAALWFSGTIGVMLLGLVWFQVLGPDLVLREGFESPQVFSAIYPTADIVLLLVPSMFVVMLVVRIGKGGVAWPWYAVGCGVMLLAASDVAYVFLTSIKSMSGAGLVSFGWMGAHVFVALGASLAYDVAHPIAPAVQLVPERTKA